MAVSEELGRWSYLPTYVRDYLGIPLAYLFGFVNYRQLVRIKKVKTKEPHVCKACKREIPAGSEAYVLTFRRGQFGPWFSKYYHADCYKREVERVKRDLLKALDEFFYKYSEEGRDIWS
ncbi:hypothetical protein E3E23_00515 [Thermococcus sp. CX2]|uniref:hypothetical protein n=1 Tax=Thermococcus sp. CX2 TaxID=163006 RepID=UPI00143952F6|nr:hypothetical protein [Thermococcus sp. CX2]NJE84330.1 hypothetical protein [Thermococcus sp. CX2]